MLASFARRSGIESRVPFSAWAAALLILSGTPGWAADRSAQKVFRQVEAECLNEDVLAALRCQTTPVSRLPEAIRENYDRSGARESLLDPLHIGSVTRPSHSGDISFLERMKRHRNATRDCRPAPDVAPESQYCQSEPTNAEEFELFLRLVRARTQALEARVPDSARAYFRAYVAKCTTSVSMNYIEREKRSFWEFLGERFATPVEELWAEGQGECSEYATVMTELGRSLGVATWNVTTLFHEFNAVKIGNETLYLDAASPSCQFFSQD